MDIARPDIKRKKKRRLVVWAALGIVGVSALAFAVSRLKPAAPTVDRSTIWTDTVKRGPLIRQVRSSTGSLVPREDSIELIPAETEATVVRIRVLPGAQVTPNTVIMDLNDPQLEQELLNAQLGLKAAQADYKSLQATLESTLMDKKTAAAQVDADYTQDQLQAQTDKALFDLGVISGLTYSKSKSTADQLTTQHQLSMQQLDVNQKAIAVQLASQKTKIDQAQALLDLYEKQSQALEVRSTITGTLAPLAMPVQVGEHVTAGTSVAEVIQNDKLKAALQIAETQARDIQIGQPASIDTHNGIIPGHVTRIDPSVVNGTRTVDVALDGPLPAGGGSAVERRRHHRSGAHERCALRGQAGSRQRELHVEPVQDRSRRQGSHARAGQGGPRFGQRYPGARRPKRGRHRNSLRYVALGQRGPHKAGVGTGAQGLGTKGPGTKGLGNREWRSTRAQTGG